MCGITGWVDFERNLNLETRIIWNMTEALSHRGPDATGIWEDDYILLGHRRLAVIDLMGGSQPMSRDFNGKKYTIVYNGELYNTSSLKEKLIANNFEFQTSSDTEVLLMSYIQWGEDCLSKINGIFAFAIWDGSKLFIARDRFGVKPLFFSRLDSGLVFSSEIMSLLENNLIARNIDDNGLKEILFMSPTRTPGHGIFKNVFELKPGRFISFSREGLNEKCYWKLESYAHEDNLENTADKIRQLFTDTVERQLVSDVPVGTFLSGGLDSSLITSIAARYYKKNKLGTLNTFSLDFIDNKKYFKAGEFQPNSDAEWAEKVSMHFSTEHHVYEFDNIEMAEKLKLATKRRGLPGMADVDTSLMMFCEKVKKTHTVALSGECADEVFGGYPWFFKQNLLESGTFPWMINNSERNSVFKKELVGDLNPEKYVKDCYNKAISEVVGGYKETSDQLKHREILHLNIYWFMAGLLERKDRMSMAHGLEVRVPFADHRLVQYLWNVPWEMKALYGREKGLLRYAMKGTLPDEVLYRKKSPYPKTHNPKYEEKVKSLLLEILEEPSSPINVFVDKKEILKKFSQPSSIAAPWFGQLMARPQLYAWLIQVNEWFENVIKK